MSSYVPTDWVDDVTPVDAARMDNIEAGLVAAHDGLAALDTRLDAEEAQPDIPPVEDGKWLTGAGGALVWADAPVGGGGAVEYENVWAAATPYQAGDVVEHEGVQYLAVNPSTNSEPAPPAAPSSFTPIPLVTALPTPSFDGQEVILVDVVGAATYAWRLRYVAARATNRWIFVGGSGQYAEVTTVEQTPASYGDCPTVGPSLTIPVAGLYELEIGFHGEHPGAGAYAYMSYSVAGAAVQTADELRPWLTSGAISVNQRTRIKTLPVGSIVAKYQGISLVRVSMRWMRVQPVAVGG